MTSLLPQPLRIALCAMLLLAILPRVIAALVITERLQLLLPYSWGL